MCSNYRAVTQSDRLLQYFGVHRELSEQPVDTWPLGLAPFIRLHEDGSGNKVCDDGVFGLLPHFQAEMAAGRKTYNARTETVATRPTYRDAWAAGRRCLIPAAWYQEPNWETGRNVWWRLTRADAEPWAIAGLWSEWTDPATGEIVPNFTLLTVNCDGHPLLGRLHKPDPKLPADAQDKRSVVPLEPEQWAPWFAATPVEAMGMLKAPPMERFDLADARRTDQLLGRS